MARKLRFALFGAGFWARYQLHGWYEDKDVECVALYNRTLSKAQTLADEFHIPHVYDDPCTLLKTESLDFVDICTNVETHAEFTRLAAARRLPVVCQKPMATSLEAAHEMLSICQKAGVPLLINENWRWQYPLRQFKRILDEGRIGEPFRARVHFVNSFPVFENQPFLRNLEQFIIADMGSHILDTARYLFGDAQSLYCRAMRVHPDIRGEDVATILMEMGPRPTTVICEMSYASLTEIEQFPQTYVYVEGNRGFLELGPEYNVRETTEAGTLVHRFPPSHFEWADPRYDVVHCSIAPCQANLLAHLRGESLAETRAEENIKSVELIYSSYESVRTGQAIWFEHSAD
jgi:predicted dehydrogenase